MRRSSCGSCCAPVTLCLTDMGVLGMYICNGFCNYYWVSWDTVTRLRICAVWLVSLLAEWKGRGCLLGDSEDSDQTVWRLRLVEVCAGRTATL